MADTADFIVSDNVKLSGLDAGWANTREIQQVFVWDLGPEKPVYPERPSVHLKGKEGDLEYEVSKANLEPIVEQYKQDMASYGRRKAEYEQFQRQYGGPIELQWWSIDATQNMEKDARAVAEGRQQMRRYYISSRTRGWKNIPNRGLPEGMKPGHGQLAQERRDLEYDSEFAAVRRADPVFGQQELR